MRRMGGSAVAEAAVNTGACNDFNWDPAAASPRPEECFPCGPCGPQFGRKKGPQRGYLGFSEVVEGGASAVITLQPSEIFTGYGFILPAASMNPGISLDSVKVGINEQLTLGPVPLSIFSEVSTERSLDMDTCQIGQTIKLSVTNNNAGAVTVEGAVIGVVNRC